MTSISDASFPWLNALGRLLWPAGPARRKRWVILAGLLLLGLAAQTIWMAVASTRLIRATEAITAEWGSLAPSTLAPPAVEDGDNAARAVRAAAEMLVLPPETPGRREAVSVRGYGSFKQDAPSAEEIGDLQRIVAANAEALRLLDAAVLRPGASWNLGYARGLEAEIPDLRRLIDLARLNIVAGRLAVEEGRQEDVVQAISRAGAIERSLAQEPVLIVQLTRASLQRLQVALLRLWLSRMAPAADGLATAAAALSEPVSFSMREAFIAEAKVVLHALLDRGGPELPVSATGSVLSLGLTWLARPMALDNARAYLGYMNQAAVCAGAPRHARQSWCAAPGQLGRYHVLARTAVVDVAGCMGRGDLAASRAVLARLALALERLRQDEGAYPATLDGLEESLRIDPLTGRPFSYALEDGGYALASHAWLEAERGGAPLLDGLEPGDPVLQWKLQRRQPGS